MTPAQLRLLREQKGMTRDQLAAHLKQSTSAITKWEHGDRPIPAMVADRMLSEVEIKLPLQEMQQLYDLGMKLGKSFDEMLKMAIRGVLTQPPAQPQQQPAKPSYRDIAPPESLVLNEQPPKKGKDDGKVTISWQEDASLPQLPPQTKGKAKRS